MPMIWAFLQTNLTPTDFSINDLCIIGDFMWLFDCYDVGKFSFVV